MVSINVQASANEIAENMDQPEDWADLLETAGSKRYMPDKEWFQDVARMITPDGKSFIAALMLAVSEYETHE